VHFAFFSAFPRTGKMKRKNPNASGFLKVRYAAQRLVANLWRLNFLLRDANDLLDLGSVQKNDQVDSMQQEVYSTNLL
jgi:hypothetical protein